nr:ribosome rescue GTPase HflX [Stagnimonas aquatica]
MERPQGGQKAVLVHLELPGSDFESDRREFEELARSAGAEIVAVIGGSRQRPDAGMFIGSGKADEVAAACAAGEAEVAIFNHELSPAQERNLERVLRCRVLSRAGLILDIFAKRARTHEGKLQVELAQLQHLATRLVRGWTHLERQQGGGIGLSGPGETQLELDRRLIKDRMAHLRRQLEDVKRHRALSRRARKRNETPLVSIVGYTNAGKSTLFNSMTGAEAYAADQLFATLDTTIRKLQLPADQEILLADTVGFIRDLPHDLVAAFRATLEEAREADLLLHVLDAADPERASRIEQVNAVLQEIEAEEVPTLLVFNKIDLSEHETARVERDEAGRPKRVFLSARTGEGLDALREVLSELIFPDLFEGEMAVTPAQGKLRALLYASHAVQAERIDDKGVSHLQLRLPRPRYERICREAGVPLNGAAAARPLESWERGRTRAGRSTTGVRD